MPLYRVLPPVFRDIWLRLKEEEDGKERQDTLEKANSAIDLLNAIPTKPTLLLSTRNTSSWFASQKEAMSEEWSVDVQGAGHERTLVDLEERKTRLLASSPSFVALSVSVHTCYHFRVALPNKAIPILSISPFSPISRNPAYPSRSTSTGSS
jgi:hypothetical protein